MKRSDNIAWSQVKVGIFIVCALIFLAGGILIMGKQTKLFTPKGHLSVIMTDVAGLKVGAPVWLAGVDVGAVDRHRLQSPPRKATRCRSTWKWTGMLSRRSAPIRSSPSRPAASWARSTWTSPRARFTPKLPRSGSTGRRVPKLDDVVQKAGTTFDQLNKIVGKMNQGEGSLGKFANDPKLYDNLVGLTFEMKDLANAFNRGEGTIGKLAHNSEPYDKLVSILNRADTTLKDIQSSNGTLDKLIHDRQLYDKMVSLVDKSNQAADDVRELNRKLTSSESSIGKFLTDREFYDKGIALIDRADRSVKSFEEITARVNRGEGTVGKLLEDKEVYEKLDRMVDDLDRLVKDIKEHPKRYVKFSLF